MQEVRSMLPTQTDAVSIIGLGAATPVGRGCWSSTAAVRAAVSGFSQHPTMADIEGRPVQVASCPWIAPSVAVAERIRELLFDAISEALQPVAALGGVSKPSIGLLINLPLSRRGVTDDLERLLQRTLAPAFQERIHSFTVARRGHAGAMLAFKSAVAALQANTMDFCVVAGGDSYLSLETLEWLEETEQLHGAGARNNAWGFVPGEGAGAVLLARDQTARMFGITPMAVVAAVGTAKEQALIRMDSVCLGLGLTSAFRQVFSQLAGRVSDTYCDMNGEPYRADEFGFAVTRTREHFVSPSDFVAPADCWGDVGAASGPLSVCLAVVAHHKRYARGDVALVWASSDSGERGAVLVVPR
jgi:3-oxoacyl-[acyl-carrier-protein] synthase-1